MTADMVCCPLDGGDEPPAFCHTTMPRARKEHRCTECHETIAVGDRHEATRGKWASSMSTFRTCLSCVEIRNHFACGSGWVYGDVWSQLEDSFFPDMKAGGPCMAGLSPEAKARLFARRMKWLEER